MERESFEDPEVAELLNRHFVSIKVDREERPDVDHIYMNVCQALTGSGGWPLSIFLTPEQKPFYAGTYFPKMSRGGLPGFMTLLDRIEEAWREDPEKLALSADKIVEAVLSQEDTGSAPVPKDLLYKAFSDFLRAHDSTHGGFGRAPKFPSPHNLYFLLRYSVLEKEPEALKMVCKTLDSMAAGGLYDHIGWGFSRYSTDRRWLVPHFEKMLYDNALLSMAYLEAYQATQDPRYAKTAEEIFSYILRDMRAPEGGFYSAEDADSEGVEGKFYVWSKAEVLNILGPEDGERYCAYYDITEQGNFEHKNIPNRIHGGEQPDEHFVESCRQKLFREREKRVHPHKDDKILTSWNGLMIAALAMGGRILQDERWTDASRQAFAFIEAQLVLPDGRLMARYREGDVAHLGYVDDYAFLIWGLLELYEATFEPPYLQKALQFNGELIRLFWDEQSGGLFLYGSDGEPLLMRPKEIYDGAAPSGNSVSAMNFLRLARLTGHRDLEELAQKLFHAFSSSLSQVPMGHAALLAAWTYSRAKGKEVVLAGRDDTAGMLEMLEALRGAFLPFTSVLRIGSEYPEMDEIAPFTRDYPKDVQTATAYICENFSCRAPLLDPALFREALGIR